MNLKYALSHPIYPSATIKGDFLWLGDYLPLYSTRLAPFVAFYLWRQRMSAIWTSDCCPRIAPDDISLSDVSWSRAWY